MKWKILKSKKLIENKWINIRIDTCKMPNETIVSPYYVLEYPNWVNIVAITKNEEIVFTKQYRHGIGKICLELPCGGIENKDATPKNAIQRELLEETGYTCKQYVLTDFIYPNPSNHSNKCFCFLGLDAKLSSEQHLDTTEDIKVRLIHIKKVKKMLEKGEIKQSMHISSLFFALNYLKKSHTLLRQIPR